MKKIKRVSAKDQVLSTIRKEIFNGSLHSGQEITQEEIASLLGVSRMPVREAFEVLDREGLLRIESTRRVTVVGLKYEEIHIHYEIRSLLEGLAASHAAANTAYHKQLEKIHQELYNSSSKQDKQPYVEINKQFHQTIWEASNSVKLTSMLNDLWNGLQPQLPALVTGQTEASINDHRRVLEAILDRDGEKAREYMQVHIISSRDSFIENFENK
ncbi:GntR family transcriptional regulator [Virgibacillus sp. NKC19-16]|uniref:GntR family transcriptional regulator n=1 Tax=Virgibacillus salidurans TaxID=2831673 RepID=UPI001F3B25DB|nr:GntR family transcriptional regulator [Virgibacillus sp. NKC19-16]UJL47702.1 GntR family transcriptional regulator [Virgibacillus sp. NKC19-16]